MVRTAGAGAGAGATDRTVVTLVAVDLAATAVAPPRKPDNDDVVAVDTVASCRTLTVVVRVVTDGTAVVVTALRGGGAGLNAGAAVGIAPAPDVFSSSVPACMTDNARQTRNGVCNYPERAEFR